VKIDIAPDQKILVDASAAAALCGVSRSTWLSWDSTGHCPRAIRLGGRVLWAVEALKVWALTGCPNREMQMQEASQ